MKNRILKWGLLSFVFTLMLVGCPSTEQFDNVASTPFALNVKTAGNETTVASTLAKAIITFVQNANGGAYTVTLSHVNQTVEIYYTIDGSLPVVGGDTTTLYSTSFTATNGTVVKALSHVNARIRKCKKMRIKISNQEL